MLETEESYVKEVIQLLEENREESDLEIARKKLEIEEDK